MWQDIDVMKLSGTVVGKIVLPGLTTEKGVISKVNDFNAYQKWTDQMAIYGDAIDDLIESCTGQESEELARLLRISYVALGLGESGEVQGKIKKILRDSKGVITPEVVAAVSKELGDQLYYLARMATEFGLHLGDIAKQNQEKLTSRKDREVIQGSGDNR